MGKRRKNIFKSLGRSIKRTVKKDARKLRKTAKRDLRKLGRGARRIGKAYRKARPYIRKGAARLDKFGDKAVPILTAINPELGEAAATAHRALKFGRKVDSVLTRKRTRAIGKALGSLIHKPKKRKKRGR